MQFNLNKNLAIKFKLKEIKVSGIKIKIFSLMNGFYIQSVCLLDTLFMRQWNIVLKRYFITFKIFMKPLESQ